MDSSPLFLLPAELRNEIYELALYHSEGITVRILTGHPQIKAGPDHNNVLALATTCCQIRRECSQIVYELNKFRLIARPVGQHYDGEIWQKGLRSWLDQIGDRNRRSLSEVEIDIGTSFMYDFYPTSETIWRSVSALLCLFYTETTRVSMRTEVNWMSRSSYTFGLAMSLTDSLAARKSVDEAIEVQRLALESWCQTRNVGERGARYRRVELQTSKQELLNFVSLIEITKT